MPRFVVDLGDIDMSKADEMALASDIQRLALNRVADLRFEKPVAFWFPHEWLGIILDPDFGGIGPRAAEIGKSLSRF